MQYVLRLTQILQKPYVKVKYRFQPLHWTTNSQNDLGQKQKKICQVCFSQSLCEEISWIFPDVILLKAEFEIPHYFSSNVISKLSSRALHEMTIYFQEAVRAWFYFKAKEAEVACLCYKYITNYNICSMFWQYCLNITQ